MIFDKPLPPINTFWYVATPYSEYPHGTFVAYVDACRAAAALIEEGIPIFCPIAHTHPINEWGELHRDKGDLDFWLPVDQPMMDAAGGIIVVMMEDWETSTGVSYEIDEFNKAGKPVRFLEWPVEK